MLPRLRHRQVVASMHFLHFVMTGIFMHGHTSHTWLYMNNMFLFLVSTLLIGQSSELRKSFGWQKHDDPRCSSKPHEHFFAVGVDPATGGGASVRVEWRWGMHSHTPHTRTPLSTPHSHKNAPRHDSTPRFTKQMNPPTRVPITCVLITPFTILQGN